ncbi:hypothetical protein FRC07_007878 [Ceratobasidium sp. 392]|nr:hypothetical protein FRC07_007878 [Ceratobasidium sp. 392]
MANAVIPVSPEPQVFEREYYDLVEGADDGFALASTFFANVFGGKRFMDWLEEMTDAAEVMMPDEGRAARATEAGQCMPLNPQTTTSTTATSPKADAATTSSQSDVGNNLGPMSPNIAPDLVPTLTQTDSDVVKHDGSGAATLTGTTVKGGGKKRKNRISPDQRRKMEELDAQRVKAMEERIETLSEKLKERIGPFMVSEKPGNKEGHEVKAWLAKIKTEADDLKQESFGVELLNTMGSSLIERVEIRPTQAMITGTVYSTKANSALKSHEFLGIPGFVSRLKEKGALVKEAWGVFGSAVGVQQAMDKMKQLQEKGEAAEAELRLLERNSTGKALCLIGELLKEVKPDGSDEERSDLEQLVARASKEK